jgi:hypothetical protein
MKRDIFGICLSKTMLSNHRSSTFTHVRAYEQLDTEEGARVMHAFPQMSGEQILESMGAAKSLLWRAEYACTQHH